MKNFGKFLLGTVIGAITGATLVLMFTPSSGAALRNKVCENFTMIRSDVRNAAQQKRDELQAELARLQKRDLPL